MLLGVSDPFERAEMVNSVYFAMRFIDDGVDGDWLIKMLIELVDAMVQEKKKTIRGLNELNKKDLFDVLVEKIFLITDRINEREQVAKGMEELMESMAFDGRRRVVRKKTGRLERKTAEELEIHFRQLDVR